MCRFDSTFSKSPHTSKALTLKHFVFTWLCSILIGEYNMDKQVWPLPTVDCRMKIFVKRWSKHFWGSHCKRRHGNSL